MSNACFDEGGATLCELASTTCRSESVDFDYDALDQQPTQASNELALECACEAMRRVFDWMYQAPCKDLDGFFDRAAIACWIFVPQLRSYTLTEISGRFGKRKQSFGRWVADLKQTMPELTKHLQHIKE